MEKDDLKDAISSLMDHTDEAIVKAAVVLMDLIEHTSLEELNADDILKSAKSLLDLMMEYNSQEEWKGAVKVALITLINICESADHSKDKKKTIKALQSQLAEEFKAEEGDQERRIVMRKAGANLKEGNTCACNLST